jgi:flagellin
MIALQSLSATSKRHAEVTNIVGTGLKVSGAVDDASSFTIAQGVRTEIRAWQAVEQGLGTALGAVKVAIAGATNISNLLNDLREKYIEYQSTDAARQPIVENDMNQMLAQIDLMANGANFGSTNFINTDQANLAFPPIPDEGSTFTLSGGGPQSGVHSLNAQPGILTVSYSAVGNGGGSARLVYDGSIRDQANFNPPQGQSGTLSIPYDGTGPTTFTMQKNGSPNVDLTYSFSFVETNSGDLPGEYEVLESIDGSSIDVQFRSMLAADLELTSINLTDFTAGLAQIDAAITEVALDLGYYGSKYQEIAAAKNGASRFADAQSEGLGNIVDADMARASADLISVQLRKDLSVNIVKQTSASPSALLGLFPST